MAFSYSGIVSLSGITQNAATPTVNVSWIISEPTMAYRTYLSGTIFALTTSNVIITSQSVLYSTQINVPSEDFFTVSLTHANLASQVFKISGVVAYRYLNNTGDQIAPLTTGTWLGATTSLYVRDYSGSSITVGIAGSDPSASTSFSNWYVFNNTFYMKLKTAGPSVVRTSNSVIPTLSSTEVYPITGFFCTTGITFSMTDSDVGLNGSGNFISTSTADQFNYPSSDTSPQPSHRLKTAFNFPLDSVSFIPVTTNLTKPSSTRYILLTGTSLNTHGFSFKDSSSWTYLSYPWSNPNSTGNNISYAKSSSLQIRQQTYSKDSYSVKDFSFISNYFTNTGTVIVSGSLGSPSDSFNYNSVYLGSNIVISTLPNKISFSSIAQFDDSNNYEFTCNGGYAASHAATLLNGGTIFRGEGIPNPDKFSRIDTGADVVVAVKASGGTVTRFSSKSAQTLYGSTRTANTWYDLPVNITKGFSIKKDSSIVFSFENSNAINILSSTSASPTALTSTGTAVFNSALAKNVNTVYISGTSIYTRLLYPVDQTKNLGSANYKVKVFRCPTYFSSSTLANLVSNTTINVTDHNFNTGLTTASGNTYVVQYFYNINTPASPQWKVSHITTFEITTGARIDYIGIVPTLDYGTYSGIDTQTYAFDCRYIVPGWGSYFSPSPSNTWEISFPSPTTPAARQSWVEYLPSDVVDMCTDSQGNIYVVEPYRVNYLASGSSIPSTGEGTTSGFTYQLFDLIAFNGKLRTLGQSLLPDSVTQSTSFKFGQIFCDRFDNLHLFLYEFNPGYTMNDHATDYTNASVSRKARIYIKLSAYKSTISGYLQYTKIDITNHDLCYCYVDSNGRFSGIRRSDNSLVKFYPDYREFTSITHSSINTSEIDVSDYLSLINISFNETTDSYLSIGTIPPGLDQGLRGSQSSGTRAYPRALKRMY